MSVVFIRPVTSERWMLEEVPVDNQKRNLQKQGFCVKVELLHIGHEFKLFKHSVPHSCFFCSKKKNNSQSVIQKCFFHLLIGSTVMELGWVKCLTRVLSFFPFLSIVLIFPFSILVQYTLFPIQSTARPDMCLSDE